MFSESLDCPKCKSPLEETDLAIKTITQEFCPHCGEMVRKTESTAIENISAITQFDINEIESMLTEFAETYDKKFYLRPRKTNDDFVWAIETVHGFAFECRYSPHCRKSVEVRLATKKYTDQVFGIALKSNDVAASHGFQMCGQRHHELIGENPGSEAYWGVFQLIRIYMVSPILLDGIAKRQTVAMHEVISYLTTE